MTDREVTSLHNIGRELIQQTRKAALATIDRKSGGPSASLIALATLVDNTPIFLISTLAEHTANLVLDQRASLLLDGTGDHGETLAGPRMTLIGTARPLQEEPEQARSRYLARHPDAINYIDFTDFAFYEFDMQRAHYVGGFGKIAHIPVAQLKTGKT